MDEKKWFNEEMKKEEKDIVAFRSWKTVYNKEGGFVDDDIEFHFRQDGIVLIDDNLSSENFVFLSKEQFQFLAHIIQENDEVKKILYG